ncbi:hypothetical protein BU26DRAFT_574015 [Trematosphaeria pertusa]|uniref:Uncharacterized protein n=1 Tax=Trematosphaeria pertusa TaxID=390896 RepID=A0A6A6J1Q1_9PLEO|nr:uncharacterized protein BU26DRAFT_574015 [Trematosphaeria pertusa]KAF2256122.1 hypothetical protein BU26DRAFT_574015 [Trematosphaeria pertusa]
MTTPLYASAAEILKDPPVVDSAKVNCGYSVWDHHAIDAVATMEPPTGEYLEFLTYRELQEKGENTVIHYDHKYKLSLLRDAEPADKVKEKWKEYQTIFKANRFLEKVTFDSVELRKRLSPAELGVQLTRICFIGLGSLAGGKVTAFRQHFLAAEIIAEVQEAVKGPGESYVLLVSGTSSPLNECANEAQEHEAEARSDLLRAHLHEDRREVHRQVLRRDRMHHLRHAQVQRS